MCLDETKVSQLLFNSCCGPFKHENMSVLKLLKEENRRLKEKQLEVKNGEIQTFISPTVQFLSPIKPVSKHGY